MTQPAETPSKVVVVGGGAGGLELAIRLARLTRPGRRAQVTLVDRCATHIWKPRLHEIGAGLLVAAEEETGYAAQAMRHGFDFVLGEADELDPLKRQVRLAPMAYPQDVRLGGDAGEGPMLPARTLDYDVAVLAIGSTVNDFGVPGVWEHCHTLNDAESSERLHRAILAHAARVQANLQPKLRVAIVGAGTTGVEFAAELREAAERLSQYSSLLTSDQFDITLLERADRPLPSSPRQMSDYARRMLQTHRIGMRFGAEAVRVDANAVELKDGSKVEADLIVWASGVKAERLKVSGCELKQVRNDRLALDETLHVLDADGRPIETLYAMGDCGAAPLADGKTVGATAQAAHQQANLLARSIARQLRGRPALPFRFRYQGALVSLGAGGVVGDLPAPGSRAGLSISGPAAKLAYASLYEAHLVELHGLVRTGALAMSTALRRSARPAVKLFW